MRLKKQTHKILWITGCILFIFFSINAQINASTIKEIRDTGQIYLVPSRKKLQVQYSSPVFVNPDRNARTVAFVKPGQRLRAMGMMSDNKWYLVRKNGKTLGYIPASCVAKRAGKQIPTVTDAKSTVRKQPSEQARSSQKVSQPPQKQEALSKSQCESVATALIAMERTPEQLEIAEQKWGSECPEKIAKFREIVEASPTDILAVTNVQNASFQQLFDALQKTPEHENAMLGKMLLPQKATTIEEIFQLTEKYPEFKPVMEAQAVAHVQTLEDARLFLRLYPDSDKKNDVITTVLRKSQPAGVEQSLLTVQVSKRHLIPEAKKENSDFESLVSSPKHPKEKKHVDVLGGYGKIVSAEDHSSIELTVNKSQSTNLREKPYAKQSKTAKIIVEKTKEKQKSTEKSTLVNSPILLGSQPTLKEMISVDFSQIDTEKPEKIYFDFEDGKPQPSFVFFAEGGSQPKALFVDVVNQKTILDGNDLQQGNNIFSRDLHVLNLGFGTRFYLIFSDLDRFSIYTPPATFFYDRQSNKVTRLEGAFIDYTDLDHDGKKEICTITPVDSYEKKKKPLTAYTLIPTADNQLVVKKFASGLTSLSKSEFERQSFQIVYNSKLARLSMYKLKKKVAQKRFKQKLEKYGITKSQAPYVLPVKILQERMHSTQSSRLVESYIYENPDDDLTAYKNELKALRYYRHFSTRSPVVSQVESLEQVYRWIDFSLENTLTDEEQEILEPISLNCANTIIGEHLYCEQNSTFQASDYTLENGKTIHFGFDFANGCDNKTKFLRFAEGEYHKLAYTLGFDRKQMILFKGHMDRSFPNENISKQKFLPNNGYKALQHQSMFDMQSLLSYKPKDVRSFFNYIMTIDHEKKFHIYTHSLEEVQEGNKLSTERW